MTDAVSVRRAISQKLPSIQDLGDGVLRGERTYEGTTFATTYIDLSDHIVERANDLARFQERLVGKDFFKGDGEQRWNSYVFFWAGPNSVNQKNFSEAKSIIEGDRHFARKFVLSEEDLIERLGNLERTKTSVRISTDASTQWEKILRSAGLGLILEGRPRTQIINLISSGEAFSMELGLQRAIPVAKDDPLSTGFLRCLRVGQFRQPISNRTFEFGSVNLIFGQNGAGKTSLLEGIEALYCGRIRRDPDAAIRGVEADMVMQNGSLAKVGPATAATIRGRNLSWYGRSNAQSSAITPAFTRFNFLDTDAAFRLASEATPEQLQNDLSLLLVGGETSALWTMLNKLRDDVATKRQSISSRIPHVRKQTELLGNEVKRLRELPSESSTLVKSFRASLLKLGYVGALAPDSLTMVSATERSALESLSTGLRQAISVGRSAPVTWALLQEREALLDGAKVALSGIQDESLTTRKELDQAEELARELRIALTTLTAWSSYRDAGVPVLVSAIERARDTVEELRPGLEGVPPEVAFDVPQEYGPLPVRQAMDTSKARMNLASDQEAAGAEALQERERLGQTLAGLRSDLRDVARAILERTSDTLHCPICGTSHLDGELLRKIEALTLSEDPGTTTGLRQVVQMARERVQRERNALTVLQQLSQFAQVKRLPESTSVDELITRLTDSRRSFADAVAELGRLDAAKDSLIALLGSDWNSYTEAYAGVRRLLGPDRDPGNPEVLGQMKASIQESVDAADAAAQKARDRLIALHEQARGRASTVGLSLVGNESLPELLVLAQRALALVHTSLAFLEHASKLLSIERDQPLEALLSAIENATVDFDRAEHAAISENNARSVLLSKLEELKISQGDLENAESQVSNLAKALEALSEIIENHSLEKASRDALASIHGNVSEIFARIHSPSEYVLGDFGQDSLLKTRDAGRSRGVHQISTGQRAALALSIFLALNRSASTAPPVLLIDDPVAHIDDLNSLSFLDYLRDIAVSSHKQIFFATADARFAALFQRKFEFLGAERFKRIVLSR